MEASDNLHAGRFRYLLYVGFDALNAPNSDHVGDDANIDTNDSSVETKIHKTKMRILLTNSFARRVRGAELVYVSNGLLVCEGLSMTKVQRLHFSGLERTQPEAVSSTRHFGRGGPRPD